MGTRKMFSFDEEKDAEEIIKNGFGTSFIDYNKMYIVAKYFRDKFGYGAIRLERELIKFCKDHDKNFNPVTEAAFIKKWVNSAMNYEMRKVDEIFVSKKEIDILSEIENDKERRLLFSTLVFSKAIKGSSTRRKNKTKSKSGNHYIRYNNLLDIIRISQVKGVSETKLCYIFNKHKEILGTKYTPEKEIIRLDFVSEEDIEIIIEDVSDVMQYYDKLFGETMEKCADCGKMFEKTTGNKVRCDLCSQKRRREKQKDLMRKKRKG